MPAEATAGPSQASYSPYSAPAPAAAPVNAPNLSVSPGLAFILGLIPGVGAIYNAQYAKGLLHVLVFATLVSLESSGGSVGSSTFLGFMIAGWYLYMPFEAYHTAKRRQMGEAVDEFSSIFPLRNTSRFPVAPVILILVGILFLLNNLNLIRFDEVARYWPVVLIALGAYMLYVRLSSSHTPVTPEVADEQR